MRVPCQVMMLWKYRQPLVGLHVAKAATKVAAKAAAKEEGTAEGAKKLGGGKRPKFAGSGGHASGLIRGVVKAFIKAAGAATADTWVVEWERPSGGGGEEEEGAGKEEVVDRAELEALIALAE